MKMKISLAMKVLYRKAKKKRRKSFKMRKEAHTKAKQYLYVPMETPSGTDAEINESNSSMSCLNEFETFADEVNADIPEVDCRGRLQSEKSLSDDEEVSHSLTQSQALKLDKPVNFLKSLLSTRTPFEEFHRLFKSVPKDQFPINDFSCALSREILLQGRIYISQGWFCFYSNIFGWETQVTIDCTKIQSITREKTAYVVPNAILICTDEEKHFFSSFLSRETVYKLLNQVWTEIKAKSKDQNTFKETTTTSNQPLDTAVSPDDNDDYREIDVEGNETIASSEVNSNCTRHSGETTEETGICWECQQIRQTATEQLANTEGTLEKHETVVTAGSCDKFYVGKKLEVVKDTARLSSCAGVAMLLASLAETLYSYLQVSLQLVRRITREQLFFLLTTFLIICLLLSSCFLLYRLSILEPRIMVSTPYQSEKILLHQSMHQLWKLRQEVFDAEVTRFKTIVAANLNAITQVGQTLKMLEEDLAAHMKRNCTQLGNNVCIQL